MAVNRLVVDKAGGVKSCQACDGRGVCAEPIQLAGGLRHVQRTCGSCGGAGKSFKHMRQRVVLDVHVQKGAPNEQKLVFREKADEHPDADTGDVIFVIKEQEHKEFKRRGADLFLERKISLAEALCGFELEVKHLDGRKLLIKSAPGEVTKPMPLGFHPMAENDGLEWDCFEGFDCPDVHSIAQAEETDVDLLKKASESQLKARGIDVGAFVVDSSGARFKQCSRADALAAKKPSAGSTMYVLADPAAAMNHRLMKAVLGEGMPTQKNPFVYGNLFLVLPIEFPESLPEASLHALGQMLPPPLNAPAISEEDDDVEVHTLSDIDPHASQAANAANMNPSGEAYDADDDARSPGMSFPGGQGPQCQQM